MGFVIRVSCSTNIILKSWHLLEGCDFGVNVGHMWEPWMKVQVVVKSLFNLRPVDQWQSALPSSDRIELLTVIGNGVRANAWDFMSKRRTPSAQRVSVPKTIKIKSNYRAYNLFRARSNFTFSPLLVMF